MMMNKEEGGGDRGGGRWMEARENIKNRKVKEKVINEERDIRVNLKKKARRKNVIE